MNTKVKVGIAGAIVAALIALIVLDQNTTPTGPDGGTAAPDPTMTIAPAPPAPSTTQAPFIIEPNQPRDTAEEQRILDAARDLFGGASTPPPASSPDPEGIKETEEPRNIIIPPAPPIEAPTVVTPVVVAPAAEYVIQQGDTYEDIALKHYGSRRHWGTIAEANPQMPPERLRVGKKIMIPASPTARSTGPTPAFEPDSLTTDRYYTVRSGDTLSGISVKVFNTSRHMQKIFDANREVIDDPNFLVVGTKLYMPDLQVRRPSSNAQNRPGAGTTVTSAPPGSKVHQVQANESLWKIAEKYAGNTGIWGMYKAILGANTNITDPSLIREGWKLIIPE